MSRQKDPMEKLRKLNRPDSEFVEKERPDPELIEAYKKIRMEEIPDLWEDIENRLTPRDPVIIHDKCAGLPVHFVPRKKKYRWVKRLSLAAAVLLIGAILVPVILENGLWNVSKGESGGLADGIRQENSMDKADEDMSSSGDADFKTDSSQDMAASEEAQDAAVVLVELSIRSIRETDGEWTVTAEILEDAGEAFQKGEILTLSADPELAGKLQAGQVQTVRLDREDEKIKITELLP